LHGLLGLTSRLSEPLPAEEVARVVVDEAQAAVGALTAIMWTVDDPPTHATLVRAAGHAPDVLERYKRIPLEPWLPMGDAMLRREALFFESRADFRDRYGVAEKQVTGREPFRELSYACLPLVVHGRAIGGVSLVFPQERAFDEDERMFLTVFAHHAAQALDRASLFEREKKAHQWLASLQQLTSALSSAATVEAVAMLATRVGAEALGLAGAGLWVTDDLGDLCLLGGYGISDESRRIFQRIAIDSTLPAARIARERRPLWCESERDLESEHPSIAAALGRGDAFQAYGALPLVRDDHVLGVLAFSAGRPRRFSPEERSFLSTVAEHCADAFARARLYDDARRAGSAKDEFLAMLGHELRNPLAPILTALHLMRSRGEGVLERERAVIERQVSHLMRLVDDLLDVSRAARGALPLERRPVELSSIVSDAIEAAGPLVDERKQRLTVSVPPTGLVIDADRGRLAQVITNLVNNAAKYTPPGGHVTVSARIDGDHVFLEVADDGAGIPPELLPHIFDAFTQGRQGLDRKQGGLGLGLAIAKQLIVGHGGTIEARSAGPGRGTSMVVQLPCAGVPSTRGAASREVAHASRRHAARRVLVVDDNPDAALTLAEALVEAGHEVRTVGDGPSALQLAETFNPDIAFLDIGLPEMDGYELARVLRRVTSLVHTPLVAITGYAQADDRHRALASGFNEHLAKPLDVDRVLECIERLSPS
jgi:signal transduction histidine kinase/ActR/RegA family two-component response regulator